MLVNNIDINKFKAILTSKDIQTAIVTTYDDWLRNSLNPLYLGKKERHKVIKLKFFIEDTCEENALNDISNLVKQLEVCTLKFDDLSFLYDCIIVNKSQERITIGRYTLEVELKSSYMYKPQIVELANRISSKTINVPGNIETPAIIEITPSVNLIDITISGFKENFTIKNLTAGQKVIVNSEDCTVIQNNINKFNDFNGWEFPTLQPGANTLSFDKNSCDITIKYKPKWI